MDTKKKETILKQVNLALEKHANTLVHLWVQEHKDVLFAMVAEWTVTTNVSCWYEGDGGICSIASTVTVVVPFPFNATKVSTRMLVGIVVVCCLNLD
jgi:hypothetical protein